MQKIFSTLLILFVPLFHLLGQRLSQFSENNNEFIEELQTYMTASQRKPMEDIFYEFEGIFSSGRFTEEEKTQIHQVSNGMLKQRMTASPYFRDYLQGVAHVKDAANGDERFKEWHAVLDSMLENIQNRRLKPYQDFLKFSRDFFEQKALRYSKTGTSWYAYGEKYEFKFEGKEPFVQFEESDLVAIRGSDSLQIEGTSGVFLPVKLIWKGKGGKVYWKRFDLGDEVYAELMEYQLQVKKSLYETSLAKMHYPLYFGNKVVPGKFSDKLVSSNKATEGSYPRFESKKEEVEIKNFGKGIDYKGGFRLNGLTVYGFGSKGNKAEITIFNDHKHLTFKGLAELFTIRREERIVGEGVEATVFFGKDSLYHPSVNFRFDMPTKVLLLSRGKRGSDRNPFYNSLQQVNIDAEKIEYHLESDSVFIGKQNLPFQKNVTPVTFESLKYFEEKDYQRLQNIATTNPIALMKVAHDETGERVLDANYLAERLNPKFTVENITSLLYDLVAKGFINYDAETHKVELKDKIFHYADAAQKNVDYDLLRVRSETPGTNAILDLKDKTTSIFGVRNVRFSSKQEVGALPFAKLIRLKQNRDMDFDGKVFAGFGTFFGKDFHFKYDKFQIEMDSVRFFDLFIPTGDLDKRGKMEALSIASRIEHLNGILLIDAPSNKSGREDIPMFPSLQSKQPSFVYYDNEDTQEGVYKRDSFYFQLTPFSFNHLDRFGRQDVYFKGTMVSADIFPPFEETILPQEDESLGFISQTPTGGFPAYQGKGRYRGEISLSNKGLLGRGTLSYLGADIFSEDFVFKPKQLTGSAKNFDMEENPEGPIVVPNVKGFDVKINWLPYNDSMYVRSKEAPFELFGQGVHTLTGLLILTPDGLKGRGLLDWDKASMRSRLFSFGAFSAKADTTNLKIKAFDTDAIALRTTNLNGIVDFDEKMGRFRANEQFATTLLPYNQYETSFNKFDWNMEEDAVTFKSDEGKLGSFLSVHPDQDSLRFQGKTAYYDLKTNLLKIGGVPDIISSDAYIYTEDGNVEIQPGGVMTELHNAKILADTTSKYHVINRATVRVLGRKEYRASGFYEYNLADKKQEIEFADIAGTRVGKGARSKKRSVTRAIGEVKEQDHFYIDYRTLFQGTISLSSEKKDLKFNGFARLDSEKLPGNNWFSVQFEGDKNDLALQYEVPKSFDGQRVRTGLFLSKETASIYPRVMMPLFYRKDRPILPVTGYMDYDKKTDRFIFGDSTKVFGNALKGNKLVFDNQTGKIEFEGRFNIGSGLKFVSVDAAGRATAEFGKAVVDTLMGTVSMDSKLKAEMMAGIKLILPQNLLNIVMTDFMSSTFEANPINYSKDRDYYQKVVTELFPPSPEVTQSLGDLLLGSLVLPPKDNPYTFLFSKIPMKWDSDYQSFISTKQKLGLVSIGGQSINSNITAYVEFKMPTNEDDRLYIYLKSPSQLYYFFGFRQGVLSLVSNNTTFNDIVLNMSEKDAIIDMGDDQTYEIQPVNPGTASAFVRRVQAAKNN